MPKYEDLPYRPCAGLCVINRKGLVFIGRRTDGPEHVDRTHVWQMPQGGIDEGEKPYPAALRELYEETSIKSVEKLGEIRRLANLRHPEKDRHQSVEGQIPRPEAEMVRAALHRQGQRDRRRESGRRTQSGVHRMALGADGESSRPRGAFQARDLRAGGQGISIQSSRNSSVSSTIPAQNKKRGRKGPRFYPRSGAQALSASPYRSGADRAP